MKKMNKVLVKLYVPALEAKYDMKIPLNKNIYEITKLLINFINEINNGIYKPSEFPMLYNKSTGKMFNINLSVKENNIINGSELVLI